MPRIRYVNFRRQSQPSLRAADHHMLDAALRGWLIIGALAFVLVPGLRSYHHLLGWLPYWLLIAPLAPLALLHRQSLSALISTGATALHSAFLVRSQQRRRRFVSTPAQARRIPAEPQLKRAA